ncbi:hypothetical protein U0070_013719, partial [Myodes glareolus]
GDPSREALNLPKVQVTTLFHFHFTGRILLRLQDSGAHRIDNFTLESRLLRYVVGTLVIETILNKQTFKPITFQRWARGHAGWSGAAASEPACGTHRGAQLSAGGEKQAGSPRLKSAGGRRREPRVSSDSSPGASAIWVRREGRAAGPWDPRAPGLQSAVPSCSSARGPRFLRLRPQRSLRREPRRQLQILEKLNELLTNMEELKEEIKFLKETIPKLEEYLQDELGGKVTVHKISPQHRARKKRPTTAPSAATNNSSEEAESEGGQVTLSIADGREHGQLNKDSEDALHHRSQSTNYSPGDTKRLSQNRTSASLSHDELPSLYKDVNSLIVEVTSGPFEEGFAASPPDEEETASPIEMTEI